jgi:gamma-glutamyltranspeptidase/glutathione hydrolase
VIDHGMTPQEAVEAPRLWTLGEELELEPGFPEQVVADLAHRGHRIKPQAVVGAGAGMIQLSEGIMTGASCWRADGTPVGIAGGMARPRLRFRTGL